jgi:2-oxoglutarate dehydrogenase E1 component
LAAEKQKRNIDSIAIVRLEQLYPFPEADFRAEIVHYSHATEVLWCQEEPRNQGAWRYVMKRLLESMTAKQQILYSTRPPSASPAVGYLHKHIEQQARIIDEALTIT